MFIVIDGIDGSGKGTIMNTWKAHLQDKGKTIFDIKAFWKEHGRHPQLEEIQHADIITTAEPSTVGIGAEIRNELIANNTAYPAYSIAQAYALDRLIIYKKLIIPLQKQGKIILQDRSVSTSLCYQSVQDNGLPMQTIADIEGNAFALSHAPDHLILCDISVDTALARLSARTEKDDNAIFEKKDFLEKARYCFESNDFQSLFTTRGTTMHTFSCEQELAIMKQNANSLLDELLYA